MRIPVVVLLGLQETLGAVFSFCVILWALTRAYEWIIKPEREARRRLVQELKEEMHRKHFEELARTSRK